MSNEPTGYLNNYLSEEKLNYLIQWHKFHELVEEHENHNNI